MPSLPRATATVSGSGFRACGSGFSNNPQGPIGLSLDRIGRWDPRTASWTTSITLTVIAARDLHKRDLHKRETSVRDSAKPCFHCRTWSQGLCGWAACQLRHPRSRQVQGLVGLGKQGMAATGLRHCDSS
eukprot:scaffold6243_cov15-Tisochrysis_lutea.AAC.4